MPDFPVELTNAQDGVTEIVAKHLNALEAKVGIDGSTIATSLDYMVRHPAIQIGIGLFEREDDENVWPIPGPPGTSVQGLPGTSIPGRDGEDGEDAWIIPGKDGASGSQGETGPQGFMGMGIPGIDGEDGNDAPIIPGRDGVSTIGPMGIPGQDGEDGEDVWPIPGKNGEPGTGGGVDVLACQIFS